jgi:hypothetical protein
MVREADYCRERTVATPIALTGRQTPTSPARFSSSINWVSPLRPMSMVARPQGTETAQRVWEVGRSKSHPVTGWIEGTPSRESGLTSNGSFFTRELD